MTHFNKDEIWEKFPTACIIVMVLCALCIALFGCTTTKTVVEYRDRLRVDTVETMRVDSVYISHYYTTHGDTIRIHDTIFKYRILDDVKIVREVVRDSIPYEVEVIKEVRRSNWYDKATAIGFWLLLSGMIIFLYFRFMK